tara:strand:- start:1343 stop:1801 length:459 start_codon:yes stop_codon:yes gene_type:complete
MNKRRLQIEQLEQKLKGFTSAKKVALPQNGWIKTVRTSLGMTLQQLADKLSISKQSVREIELREKEGSISLKSLREAANALDMEIVYGLVPKDGSIEKLIDRKASELAKQIVSRTSNNMKLEDQENTQQRLKKALEERKAIIKNEWPKTLWD